MFSYSGAYRKYAVLTPGFVLLECFLDILIPFLMARMIDVGIARRDVDYIVRTGGLMILCAAASMIFGTIAARRSAGCRGCFERPRVAFFQKFFAQGV